MMRAQRSRLIFIGSAAAVGVAALALAAAAFTSHTRHSPDKRANNVVVPLASAAVPGAIPAAQSDQIVVERVTILPYGLEPEEITRPVGPFFLAVDNRAGGDDFSLQLISAGNQLVDSAGIRRGQARTGKVLRLNPGKYVLREAKHSDWVCTITIVPQ